MPPTCRGSRARHGRWSSPASRRPPTTLIMHDPIATVLIERARRFAQANLFDRDLGSPMMQRELGLSRARLYRLFEPFGGVSHYIQHRRLLDAHAALADANDQRRIVDIAEERGFNDGAEFSRAFKRAFGYSPSEVRAGARGAPPSWPDLGLPTAAASERLGMLIRRLGTEIQCMEMRFVAIRGAGLRIYAFES